MAAGRWQALLETMERDLMASYHCEPLLPNGISKQLPQHFVTMLVAVRSLEELLASWPRTIQGKTMHLKGLLRHAGTLTVSYIGKFHLKQIQIPFDFDKPPCEKTMKVYNDFMVDFTTELEDVADFVTTWHSFLHEAAQMKHEQTLCSCELALEQGCGEITLIIDSMDQQKFFYPRAEIYKSKDLSAMVRPRSHVTACLVHGHFLLITVAEHNLPKNANCMTEILAHAPTLLRRKGIDTTKLRYRIHSDNTVRECKNNIVLSWLGSMTGRGLIAGGALACLRSGHSHEDIDQCFGNLSFFMARKGRYARHTGDFVVLIRQWLNDLKRPYEKDKYCVKLDELRDWRFDNSLRRFCSSLFSLLGQCEGANVCNILASLFFVVAEMSLDQSYKPGSPNFK